MTATQGTPSGPRSLRSVALDTVVLSAAQVVNRAKGVLLIPLVVGALGLEGYGGFVQIMALVQVLTSVATLEIAMGLERFASALAPGDREARARHFWTVLVAMLGLAAPASLAFAAAAPLLARWLLDGSHADALTIAASILLSNAAYSVARHQLRADRRFRLESALDVLYQLGPYAALVVAVLSEGALASGLLAYSLANAAAATVSVAVAAQGLKPCAPSLALLRRYVAYSAPLALSLIEGSLLARVDFFFLGSMVGLEAVAAYNVAYRLCETLQLATRPIHVQLLAYLSGIWDGGHQAQVRRVLRHALLLLMFAAAGLIAGLHAYLDPLLDLLLRSERPPSPLHPVILLVGGGLVADAIRRMLYVVIRLEKKTGRELLYQGIGLATNVAANLVLIPRFGIEGAAAATLLSYVVMLPFISARFTIGIDLGFVSQTAWFVLLAIGASLAATWLIEPEGIAAAIASAALMGAAYAGLTFVTRRSWLRTLRTDLDAVRGAASG